MDTIILTIGIAFLVTVSVLGIVFYLAVKWVKSHLSYLDVSTDNPMDYVNLVIEPEEASNQDPFITNPILTNKNRWLVILRNQITGVEPIRNARQIAIIHMKTPHTVDQQLMVDNWLGERLLRFDHELVKEALTHLTGFQVLFYKVDLAKKRKRA